MSFAVTRDNEDFLYQQVIALIRQMRDDQTISPGEKLPSLRGLASKLQVSVPTVKQGYEELERLGEIEARPKSGYYLIHDNEQRATPRRIRTAKKPVTVRKQSLIEQVYQAIHEPGVLPLGVANPVAAYPSDKMLARTMRRVMSKGGPKTIGYGPMDGYPQLKRQLAFRYLDFGLKVDPDDLLITNGAQEALAIALQTVAKAGDIVAVESPVYFGIVELIESLGMMAYELPLGADEGILLDDLTQAINQQPIKACIVSTSISNPMGSFMSDDNRKALVKLLEANNIPLIEDDVYSDLYFTEKRGIPAQGYSSKGLVITCASFSKTAAPGYRIGWMITPKFIEQAKRIKRALSCGSSTINQWTMSEFVASGDYDRNMHHLRRILLQNRDRMVAAVKKYFSADVRVSNPKGGGVLWVELKPGTDTTVLFHKALEHNISIAPGTIFSPSNRYKHCFRISYGLEWTEAIERAVETLAQLYSKL
ncbi:MAG: PLP-dependent aminotransferase family protein [Gammaproteobacteria bacterium]|nr:PLP-dependent aminotransferase family protein [Gammaproteobacteria bacterium]